MPCKPWSLSFGLKAMNVHMGKKVKIHIYKFFLQILHIKGSHCIGLTILLVFCFSFVGFKIWLKLSA
jgi:hypothetical protein